jgi:hypothetical protein
VLNRFVRGERRVKSIDAPVRWDVSSRRGDVSESLAAQRGCVSTETRRGVEMVENADRNSAGAKAP